MSGADIISIAITLSAIAAASWFTNVRISNLATVTNKGFDDMRDLMRSETAHTQDKLDTIIRILGGLNARLRRLED